MSTHAVFLSALLIGLVFGGDSCPSLMTPASLSSITQQNITITFDSAYTVGQYITGDYWILDPGSGVTVNSITPTHIIENGKRINGFNINPSSSTESGFDTDVPTFNLTLWDNTLPLVVNGGSSIVKSVSVDSNRPSPCRPCIERAVVFTIVDAAPENDGHTVFRPPYFGDEKTVYTKSMIDLSSFSQYDSSLLADMDNPLELATVQDNFVRVHLDHKTNYQSRQMHPEDNMPDYGSSMGIQSSRAVVRLLFDDVTEDSCALHAYLQNGIDLYAMMRGGVCWSANGGHGNGRKIVITFAAAVFAGEYPEMGPAIADHGCWHEDDMLSRGRDGQVLWGQSSSSSQYWQNVEDDSGLRTAKDPYGYVDGGRLPGTSYQYCCNSQLWKGAALALCSNPTLRSAWSYDEFIIYVGRWVNCGAWALPDPCAPMQGNCTGAPAGTACTSANYGSVCPADEVCETASTPGPQRGVSYGDSPSGEGECIEGGSGRFPERHGANVDEGGYTSPFVNELFPLLWDECVVDPCLASASVKGDPGADGSAAVRLPAFF